MFLRTLSALLLALSPAGVTQQATTSPSSAPATPEITSHEVLPTFTKKVNLVEVRVVVRDAKGRLVDNLKQDDFQLFDNGKPQVISKFSVERATEKPTVHSEPAPATPSEGVAPAPTVQPVVAKRFIAYLFDDMHLALPDLATARNAAIKHLQSLRPEDRVGVFSASGMGQQAFTDDHAELIAAINRIVPRSQQSSVVRDCPDISYYMADMIVNKHDQIVSQMALQDAQDCGAGSSSQPQVEAAARRELEIGDNEVQISLTTLEALVHRMAELPGQRTIVLVSPGFMNSDLQWKETEVMDRAVHASVVINTLDARGLYTPGPDVSETRQPSPKISGRIEQYRMAEQDENQVVLADLADATGGAFFHNNNDLDEGFQRLASPPEVSYLLAFAPANLKLDGGYHNLKVKLKSPAEGRVQARKGYFAPKAAVDASEQAKAAIEDAVFSQEEVHEIPVELHTQYFKPNDHEAKLSVLARVDLKQIHFQKANGRNNDDVTVVSALFDGNGNFIAGNQKQLQLHLKDETLQSRLGSGITLKSSFDVKPGNYVVRLVVRDGEGQLAARNLAVQIP